MFFVFGTPRSGTTLLAQCLSAHSELVVPYETDFIIPMTFLFDRIQNPERGRRMIHELIVGAAAFQHSLGEYVSEEEVRSAIQASDYHPAEILDAIYSKVAAAAGARIAGDKSPNDLFFVRMLLKTGGISAATKIIHIVRDIRDVMVSLSRTGWAPSNLDAYFPRYWCAHNLYLHALYEPEPHRYVLVRYEDLVSEPEREVGRCCRVLGVEFEPAMLLPSIRHERYRNMPSLTRVYEPITSARVGTYRDSVAPGILLEYETQAKEALIAFGYLKA